MLSSTLVAQIPSPRFGGSIAKCLAWRCLGCIPTSHLVPPQASSSLPHTVYTIRMTTSLQRGAALSDSMVGVNICLIGKDRRAVLHRVAPVNDPEEQQACMHALCAVRHAPCRPGRMHGAPCSRLAHWLWRSHQGGQEATDSAGEAVPWHMNAPQLNVSLS